MKDFAQCVPPQVNPGSGGVSGEAKCRKSSADHSRRNEAILEIAADALPDKAVRGLLDDWLVPMIVERMIEERVKVKDAP